MADGIVLVLALLPIHFAVMISPGPNFVLLSTTALSSGRREALRAAFGVSLGSLIWMLAAVVGVSVLLEGLPALGLALKVVGGAYLVYLGYRLWTAKGMAGDRAAKVGARKTGSFRRGLIANLTNPKSAAYFGSIFAAFLTDEISSLLLAGLIPILFLVSIAWHSALATTFSAEAFREPYLRHARTINRIAGAILVAFGLRMTSAVVTS